MPANAAAREPLNQASGPRDVTPSKRLPRTLSRRGTESSRAGRPRCGKKREMVVLRVTTCAAVLVAVCSQLAHAQVTPPGRVGVVVEGLAVWQQRNDVRIPPDTGTEFSIVDLIGSAGTAALRVEVTADLADRQDVRLVYAPLRIDGNGTLESPVRFAGSLFLPQATSAEYEFTSYRGTWRYRVYQGPTWTWRVGFTGFVRDARIALAQPGVSAEDTDVGFVPLAHVAADARLSRRWHLALELDGIAAPQGRAFDFAATVNYRPAPRLTLSAGYRTIEGGADVEAVYTFAWLNAAIARVGIRF